MRSSMFFSHTIRTHRVMDKSPRECTVEGKDKALKWMTLRSP